MRWITKPKPEDKIVKKISDDLGVDLNKRIKSIETDPQNLIPRVMETAIGNTKSVKIYGKNYKTIDGTAVRDYVHVSDLARAHLDAISYLHNQRKNQDQDGSRSTVEPE